MSKCHITSENIKTHIFFFFWTSVLIYQMLSWDLCCYVLHKFVYNNKKLFEWLNFEIYLIAELVCLFAENYNNLLSKVICFSFLWSVVAHLPCDLLRQSGHFWRKKGKKLGPLTCCSCCHIFDFLFSYSSCHPQPFCCSLEYVLWMSIVLQRICPPLPLKMFPPTELGSELYIANLDWPQRREIQVRCIFFLRRVFFLLLLKISDNWLTKS